ncbi:MAG TPA: NAD(P)-dependent oxidoreductase [Xanthobacteraceae bacterium]|nr:MAG: epimerase [Azorhizobium sp. 12-66-6]OZB01064.1 MAG: epimerase [Rhizobiales bacterium 39-66-18]HQS09916.1 NAD(P)-dependent oxidoreductase [Xanthobacteraceae bacterium]HQS50229.1 NAD(P)-dependent oxidoreductase [Xanthobacteraceae bacterium]
MARPPSGALDGFVRAWKLDDDLDLAVDAVGPAWEALRGARLFLTGGTGFVGRWLLETLARADARLGLGIDAVILTRDPAAFAARAPRLATRPGFSFHRGDVRAFAYPRGDFTHFIHGATDSGGDLGASDPRAMFDTIALGTKRVLDFAVAKGVSRGLHLSTGAVLGRQPWDLSHMAETFPGAADGAGAFDAYGEGKRAAETLCAVYGRQFGLSVSVARLFAFAGPFQPLDSRFAIGNFIRDALAGRTVAVKGDGRAVRSYLYAGDLAAWLWCLLARGPAGGTYHVGSDEAVAVGDLAARVARLAGNGSYEIQGAADSGWNPGRYVPSVDAIVRDLGVRRTVGLDQAILRTVAWNLGAAGHG